MVRVASKSIDSVFFFRMLNLSHCLYCYDLFVMSVEKLLFERELV